IRKRTAETIQKYISKGGKFYKPRDIKKIYGLSETDVERLIPYVSIKIFKKDFSAKEEKFFAKENYTPKSAIQTFDINLADTSAYISLPGIGSKLAKRILAFREKLGGFYSVEQVGETYFLPDSTFQKIKKYLFIKDPFIKKININATSVDVMKAHPYINYNVANAIFQYRQQHGDYKSVQEIKKIMTITDDVYNKTVPYLTTE
ncbi:MAG: helix-hairpin-helix domain-containing protein, partial [Ginsengibacter sp.]